MPKKVNTKRLNLLRYVAEAGTQFSIKTLADTEGVTYHAIYKRLKLLEKRGLIDHIRAAHRNLYFITDKGIKAMADPSRGIEKVKSELNPPYRLHYNIFTVDIIKKPKNWNKERPRLILIQHQKHTQARIKNNTVDYLKLIDVVIKLCNNQIEIMLPKDKNIIEDTPTEADQESTAWFISTLPKVERILKKLGVTIRSSFQTPTTFKQKQSYGHPRDLLAEKIVHMQKEGQAPAPYEVYDKDGELLGYVDKSVGPEMEFPRREYAENWQKHQRAILTGEVDLIKMEKRIELITKALNELVDVQESFLEANKAQTKPKCTQDLGKVRGYG